MTDGTAFAGHAVEFRFPGSPYCCYLSKLPLVFRGPVASTRTPAEVACFETPESARAYLVREGLADGGVVPVGVGMVARVVPFDAGNPPPAETLLGSLFELPNLHARQSGRGECPPAPAPAPTPPPAPKRAAQASLF